MDRPCVYILTNKRHGTLYVGVTGNVARRLWQHRNDVADGFSKHHGLHRAVLVEFHDTMADAILREKRIKKWRRAWKIRLIEGTKPDWRDLYDDTLR